MKPSRSVLCILLVGGVLSCDARTDGEAPSVNTTHAKHAAVTRNWHGAPPHGMGPFAVSDVRVIDGDSLDVSIGGGRVAVRILGVDAPEGNTPCGRAATAQLERLVARGLTLSDDPDASLTMDA